MPDTYDDYLPLFPEHKRLARALLLREAAQMAAASVSRKIRALHHDDSAVSSLIGEARSLAYVDAYVERVIRFKMDNDIGPQNRVEAPKIAAIMVAYLHSRPIAELFSFSDGYTTDCSAYPSVARGTFLNRIVYAFLGLPGGFVNEGLGQDLHRVLVTEDLTNVRLLAVLFKGVFLARGVAANCLED